MGIDGIGKGGAGGIGGPGGPGGSGAPAAPKTEGAAEAFRTQLESPAVDATNATNATSATGATAQTSAVAGAEASPLGQLRSGQITLNQYLDLKVDQATAHVGGALPTHQRTAIRDALRAQMSSDPALVDLVRTATGQVPEPSDGA